MENVKLGKLASDLYNHRVTNYSESDAETVLRNAMIDCIGKMPGEQGFYQAFRENERKFYAIVEETITEETRRITADYFADWVDYKDYPFGTKPEFKVVDDQLYRVSAIATGMKSLRRQKLYGKRIGTEAFTIGLKIYEEYFDFMMGNINWGVCVNRVAASFANEVAKIVSKCFFSAYEALNGTLVATAYSDAALIKIVREIEAKTGRKCDIYGTAAALDQIEGADSITDREDLRNFGYVKVFKGRRCIELPQIFNEDKGANEVPEDMLLIIPAGEKILKVGFEGEAMVFEDTNPATREDMQVEFSFMRRVHVGVAVAAKFGCLKFTA